MTRKAPLRVVPPDSRAPEVPKTVREAAEVSERALLVALRSKIAGDIDRGVPPHALAPLSRQLREIDKDIRAIDAHDEGDDVGDAAATPDEEWAVT